MNRLLVALGSLIVLAGCNAPDNKDVRKPDQTVTDNSGRATRNLTPGDSAENDADAAIVQNIRSGLSSDSTLSALGKTIRIKVKDGVVTLSGPVSSLGEKQNIELRIRQVPGVKKIDNQLEVKSANNN